MRTSYSNIQTFKQCPQKFKFQVIDKIKATKTVHTVFGSSVHAALKFMFSHDPVFPTMDEILANFTEAWATSVLKIVPALDNKLISIYEESGKSLLKNFYKNNPPWNFSVVDTESKFELPIEDSNGGVHVLAGIIDRVDKLSDGVYEIIDYKTNRKLPSQGAVDGDLQMSIYHMALNRRWPSLDPAKIKLSLYFLKHGEKISRRMHFPRLSQYFAIIARTNPFALHGSIFIKKRIFRRRTKPSSSRCFRNILPLKSRKQIMISA